eukprot:13091698-Heterocapsa_arctica.AAC.1
MRHADTGGILTPALPAAMARQQLDISGLLKCPEHASFLSHKTAVPLNGMLANFQIEFSDFS